MMGYDGNDGRSGWSGSIFVFFASLLPVELSRICLRFSVSLPPSMAPSRERLQCGVASSECSCVCAVD